MKRLDLLISPFLQEFGMEEAVRFEGIKKDWTGIFRDPLSHHMSPGSLKNGELLITVESSVWFQQLTFLKGEIIRSLSPYGVRDVRFRIGKVNAKKTAESHNVREEKQPINSEALQQIEDTVSEIKDAEVRESIRKVMGKSFAARNAKS